MIAALVVGVAGVMSTANVVALVEVDALADLPIFGVGLGVGLVTRLTGERQSETAVRIGAALVTLAALVPLEYASYSFYDGDGFTSDALAVSEFASFITDDVSYDPTIASSWLLAAVLAGAVAKPLGNGPWADVLRYDGEMGTSDFPVDHEVIAPPAAQIVSVTSGNDGHNVVVLSAVIERGDGSFLHRRVECRADVVDRVAHHLLDPTSAHLQSLTELPHRPLVREVVLPTAEAARESAHRDTPAAGRHDWQEAETLCSDLRTPSTMRRLAYPVDEPFDVAGAGLVALLAGAAFVAMLWGYAPLMAFLEGSPSRDGLTLLAVLVALGMAANVGWLTRFGVLRLREASGAGTGPSRRDRFQRGPGES